MIRFGLVGCGAAIQQLHVPAFRRVPDLTVTCVADVREDLAQTVADAVGCTRVVRDYTTMTDVDAVLIATPHHLHGAMNAFFIGRGVHVLCEKPLALGTGEAEALVKSAHRATRVLAVGVFRRYYPVSDVVRQMIATDWLGAVDRVDAEEGVPYDWDFKSAFMVDRDKAGGGVLVDTGAHTIDRLLWWFGSPNAALDAYSDNSRGGPESDCELRFTIPWGTHHVPARVELSRTRTLRNTFEIHFSSGATVQVPVNEPHRLTIKDPRFRDVDGATLALESETRLSGAESLPGREAYFVTQLTDFVRAIQTGQPPRNDAATVLPVVRLADACYAARQPMSEPWVEQGMDIRLTRT